MKKRAKKMLKKNKKVKPDAYAVDGKMSKTLVRIFESRSKGCKITDIFPICQEYMKLAIEYGNRYGNTKYVIHYMLKTHKEREDLFLSISGSKNMLDMAKIFEVEDFYNEQIETKASLMKNFSDTYYKSKKAKIDENKD